MANFPYYGASEFIIYSEEIELSWLFRKYSLEKENSRGSFQKPLSIYLKIHR